LGLGGDVVVKCMLVPDPPCSEKYAVSSIGKPCFEKED
jgi:hypothetical protein